MQGLLTTTLYSLLANGYADSTVVTTNIGVETKQQNWVIYPTNTDPLVGSMLASQYVQEYTNTEKVYPVGIEELLRSASAKVVAGANLEVCSVAEVPSIRIKILLQQVDHALSYMEIDKAQVLLENAKHSLPCLDEVVDIDMVARLYFLQGILAFYQEDTVRATKAFLTAFFYKPNMQWDDIFAPDPKDVFDQAKMSFVKEKLITLQIIPVSAQEQIWVNGVPSLASEQLSLHQGHNVVQIVGSAEEDVQTLFLDVDGSQPVQIVAPNAITNIPHNWLENTAFVQDFQIVLSSVWKEDQRLFALQDAQLWEFSSSNAQWQPIEYNFGTSVEDYLAKRKRRDTIGKGLMWTGLGITTVSTVYTGSQYSHMFSASAEANASSDLSWKEMQGLYRTHSIAHQQYQMGAMAMGIGAVVGLLGYGLQR